MPVAYLILAHREPGQVVRLVRRLRAQSEGPVLVHIDRRTRTQFDDAARQLATLPRVSVISTQRVYWGHYSIVQAALDGLGVLLRDNPDVTHIKHLTGQDYPIKPLPAFEAHMAGIAGRSAMDIAPLPFSGWGSDGGLLRVRFAYVRSPIHGLLRRTNRLVPIPIPRPLPAGVRFHGGSAFWCIARSHAEYILGLSARLQRFFRRAFAADEIFFHTALMNSSHSAEIVAEDLTYAFWPPGAGSPAILTVDDLAALLSSPAFFARKFSQQADPEILDALDQATGAPAT